MVCSTVNDRVSCINHTNTIPSTRMSASLHHCPTVPFSILSDFYQSLNPKFLVLFPLYSLTLQSKDNLSPQCHLCVADSILLSHSKFNLEFFPKGTKICRLSGGANVAYLPLVVSCLRDLWLSPSGGSYTGFLHPAIT